MKSIVKTVGEYWEENGFTVLVVISISLLIIYGLYRLIKGEDGTYNTRYSEGDEDQLYHGTKKKRRGPPRESKGEKECKRVMEKLFGVTFRKERPDFLRNNVTSDESGGEYNLELDVFSPDILLTPEHKGVSVEFQGRQHDVWIPFFHKTREAFLNQKYRDELKRRICKENKVDLIEVSYKIKHEDIESYLRQELTKLGYDKLFVSNNETSN